MELVGYLFQLQAVQSRDGLLQDAHHCFAVAGYLVVGSEHRDASLVVDCHSWSPIIYKVRHYQRKAKAAI